MTGSRGEGMERTVTKLAEGVSPEKPAIIRPGAPVASIMARMR